MRLRFGEITFDAGRHAVFRGPEHVRLSPKAFHLLELLLKRRPGAVSKSEILETLWPAKVVTEGTLACLVNEVREALGESAREATCLRTVFGFGYAFEAPVHEVRAVEPSSTGHVLLWGGQEMDLVEGENVLGRARDAAGWIGHPSISRHHARIIVEGDRAEVEDLDSKNGTFVGSHRVVGRTLLRDGDELRLGTVVLVYRNSTASSSTDTAPGL